MKRIRKFVYIGSVRAEDFVYESEDCLWGTEQGKLPSNKLETSYVLLGIIESHMCHWNFG